MDRLDIAISLIREAQGEAARIRMMNRDIEKLKGLDDENYFKIRREIEKKYYPLPHKSIVNDNLKLARRILKDEYLT